MSSHDRKLARALAYLLTSWGVRDPDMRAVELVQIVHGHGWRQPIQAGPDWRHLPPGQPPNETFVAERAALDPDRTTDAEGDT